MYKCEKLLFLFVKSWRSFISKSSRFRIVATILSELISEDFTINVHFIFVFFFQRGRLILKPRPASDLGMTHRFSGGHWVKPHILIQNIICSLQPTCSLGNLMSYAFYVRSKFHRTAFRRPWIPDCKSLTLPRLGGGLKWPATSIFSKLLPCSFC